MKVLVDMNLSPRWVKRLMEAGFEAEHWSNVDPPTAPDTAVMSLARAQGYVVLTHDLDFGAILAATKGQKPSVVQIRAENVSPESVGGLVIDAIRQMSAQLDEGALVTVDPGRSRLRILPLRPK
jgi:predicted nuclease of predicted toxin-antitoxin system